LPADNGTLTGRASRALGWSFGSTVLNKVSMLGIGVMLARLLGPHAFGTYAVAYVALVALLNFNEIGMSVAIIRWQGDPAEIVPTVRTISVSVSAFMYICCFLAAPAYASAMGAPAAASIVRILALAVLSDGFTGTPAALLQRNFRQAKRTIADMVNVWLGTAVTVALAWSGYGAMSLAIGRLVGCVAGAILLVAFVPDSLRFGFDPTKARALLRFGLPLGGAGVLTFAVGNADQVIVGHLLGPVALGIYVLALNLAAWPLGMFSKPARTVGPAVLSRLQHDGDAMRTTFLSAAGLLCAVALPMCLLIGGAATPLISFVYGVRWSPAALPLLWLALAGGVQVFFLLAYDFFVVLARSRFLLIIQLAWLLALVPALALGAHMDGIYGASLGEFAVAALCVLPWYLVELSKAGIRLRALCRHLWLPLAGAAAAGLIAVGAARAIPNAFMALAASGVATVAIVGLLVYRMRSLLTLLRSPAVNVAVNAAAVPAAHAVTAGPAPAVLVQEDRSAIRRAIDAPTPDNEPYGLPASYDVPLSRCAYPDVTGPLPAFCDILGLPPLRRDLEAASPLYQKTVASRRWDPRRPTEAATGHADSAYSASTVADASSIKRSIESSADGASVAFRSPKWDGSELPASARAKAHHFGRKLTAANADVLHETPHEERP
jgi:O-antigen/teichoic acid export membrane protein